MTVTKPDGRQSEASFHGEQSGTPKRQLVIWCPDWPVVAAATQLGLSLQLPLAVFDRGEVFACSAMARVEGVRRGMRRRDASARCPELTVLERNTASEIRTFEDVLSAIEEISAGVAPVRPGLCALRVPSRFYGGEKEAAAVVAEHLVGLGFPNWDRGRHLRGRTCCAPGSISGLLDHRPWWLGGVSGSLADRCLGER
jgi:protein ImuB